MEFLRKVRWLGHASVRIDAHKTIYFDPWNVKESPKADLILITHEHYDHCSPEDVERISTKDTIVMAPPSCASKLDRTILEVRPGQRLELCELVIRTVPAYNLTAPFHSRQSDGVGYMVTVGSTTLYHAGDTDAIEEMGGLKPDIAFLPVGGTYTMDSTQALLAIETLQPGLVVPIHYGTIVGSVKDAQELKRLSPVPVAIMPRER